jgi:predicted amidohydrolase
MGTLLRVALLQMVPCGADQEANAAIGEDYCRRARAMGADIALFPELWNIGFAFERFPRDGEAGGAPAPESPGDLWRTPELWTGDDGARPAAAPGVVERWQAQAISRGGPFVQRFQALARELEMAIAVTYLERWDGAPRNTVSLIDRRGDEILTYAKVHTCAFDLPEAALTPGDGFHVATLQTAAGDVRVGAMICYDREFPESGRVLMLKGAEVILVPNACTLDPFRLAQLRVRACENMVAVAMANYAAPQNNGHSAAFDPLIFPPSGEGSRDTLVVEAGESAGVYLATFDLQALRDYRRRETWGNAFRRPQHYAAITAPEVDEPFVRVNAHGERFDRVSR